MKTTLLAIVLLAASFAYATPPQLGDYGAEYPVWSASDPFAIAVATNTAALLTLETAARKAGDSGLSNYVDTAVAGVTASSIGALTNAVRLVSADGTYFQTVENGTGTVWQITVVSTNFVVAFSPNFQTTAGQIPPQSSYVFPFEDGAWGGGFGGTVFVTYNLENVWGAVYSEYPISLPPVAAAQGTAIVSIASITYATNLFCTFPTQAERDALDVRITAVEAMALTPAQVIGIVNPYQSTVYGSNSITNDAGYGAFLSTNHITARTKSTAATSNGQVVASYRYNITNRTDSTYGLSYYFFCSQDEKALTPVASLVSAAGVTLASYTMPTVTYMSGGSTTNVVTSFSLPQATSGWVNVSYICATDGGGTYGIRTGGAYPMALTVPVIPTAYATQGQIDGKVASTNGTAYNLALTGSPTLNGEPLGVGGSSAPTYISVATATNLAVSAGSYYIDLANWAATGMTWAANVEWDIPPELTVTGRYEFAFVTVGSKLSARQTWPERCEWHDVGNLPKSPDIFIVDWG